MGESVEVRGRREGVGGIVGRQTVRQTGWLAVWQDCRIGRTAKWAEGRNLQILCNLHIERNSVEERERGRKRKPQENPGLNARNLEFLSKERELESFSSNHLKRSRIKLLNQSTENSEQIYFTRNNIF